MIPRYKLIPLLALTAAVAGCASAAPRRDAFANIRQSVADRADHRIHWNRGSDADAEVAHSIQLMLGHPLSSEMAVQVALLNNPTLQAAYEDVGVTQAELVAAGLLHNPVFDAELRFPEGGGGTKLDLAVVADFLDVFQIPLRKRLAKTSLQSAELRTADAVLNLAAEVRAAYTDAVAAQQLLELRRTVAEAASAAAEVAQRLHEAGNITELALVSEQALGESAQLELTSAEAEAQAARLRLGQLIGVVDDAWQLPPQLPDVPGEQFTVSELEAMSLEQRLDLRGAAHPHRAARARGCPSLRCGGRARAGRRGRTRARRRMVVRPQPCHPPPAV